VAWASVRECPLRRLAVANKSLAAGALLRRYSLLIGLRFQMLASVVARLLGAVALGWAITRLLAHPSVLRVTRAVALCLLALSMILSAVIVLYALWSEARQPPDAASP
jgi:hypothetical protein